MSGAGSKIVKAKVFTNSTQLQADAANYEDIVHSLDNQFPDVSVMFMPAAGTYANSWILAYGVISVVFVDVNTIRLYNESGTAIAAGNVKVTVVG